MIILGTNSIKDTGYDVANSLRFNDGSSDHLTRTPSGSSNRRTFTISTWLKRSALGSAPMIILSAANSGNRDFIYFEGDALKVHKYNSGYDYKITTNRLFRDISAWSHICVAFDTTQGTAANRIKVYVNGVQETSLADSSYPSEDFDTNYNTVSLPQNIGKDWDSSNYFDGYLAETVMIDGSQLDPTSFGEFDEDSGIWKPKDVSGLTFGTNGFYLDFEDSSALGNDAAGSNNFTVNNLTAIDQSTDTCTNNFATGNPLQTNDLPTFSEGNLAFTSGSNHYKSGVSTIGVSSGKWFMESKFVSGTTHINGVIDEADLNAQSLTHPTAGVGFTTNSVGYISGSGNRFIADGSASYGASYTTGDIIGIALDLDSGTKTVTFYKNGASQGAINLPTGGTGTFFFAPGIYNGVSNANFGSPPFAISSGNTDGNGYGNFEYAVPSSYYSLNTKNLAEHGG